MVPVLNFNLPAQGQRSMQALRLLYRSGVPYDSPQPSSKDHRAVPRCSAQQNRESLRVRVVGILNSTSFKHVLLW